MLLRAKNVHLMGDTVLSPAWEGRIKYLWPMYVRISAGLRWTRAPVIDNVAGQVGLSVQDHIN